ncbi:MAG: hypothetical protein QOF35_65 [Actinomycetota bacterium]|nr:hypothetical protein [Actinomycetota bacterium]
MSEPNSGGGQQPGPDPDDNNVDKQDSPQSRDSRDEAADQSSDSSDTVFNDPTFNDPTAPVWAEPTTPMPSEPPVPPAPPGGAHTQSWQQGGAYAQQPPSAPASQPTSNPYAQQPPVQTYGEPGQSQPGESGQPQYSQPQYSQAQYGQPPYSQQQYGAAYGQQPGQQYPPYGQRPYSTGPHAETNTSAIALTITSGILMLSTCFVIGIPSLIFAIMALTSNANDPAGSRKQAKTGWILFAVNVGVVVLVALIGAVLLAVSSRGGGDSGTSF